MKEIIFFLFLFIPFFSGNYYNISYIEEEEKISEKNPSKEEEILGQKAFESSTSKDGRPIEEFLNKDGTLNLPKGVAVGSINAKGFKLISGKGEEPRMSCHRKKFTCPR